MFKDSSWIVIPADILQHALSCSKKAQQEGSANCGTASSCVAWWLVARNSCVKHLHLHAETDRQERFLASASSSKIVCDTAGGNLPSLTRLEVAHREIRCKDINCLRKLRSLSLSHPNIVEVTLLTRLTHLYLTETGGFNSLSHSECLLLGLAVFKACECHLSSHDVSNIREVCVDPFVKLEFANVRTPGHQVVECPRGI